VIQHLHASPGAHHKCPPWSPSPVSPTAPPRHAYLIIYLIYTPFSLQVFLRTPWSSSLETVHLKDQGSPIWLTKERLAVYTFDGSLTPVFFWIWKFFTRWRGLSTLKCMEFLGSPFVILLFFKLVSFLKCPIYPANNPLKMLAFYLEAFSPKATEFSFTLSQVTVLPIV